MRGPRGKNFRANYKPSMPDEATARTYELPAPYQGWNARGNLANMPPLMAVVLDNFFPGVQEVSLRKGFISWTTWSSLTPRTLMTYSGSTTDKLFLSSNSAIYDVTGSGALGASVATCTNGLWITTNLANSAGTFLVLVNGTDDMKVYNGAAWATINGASVPAFTGVATSALSYVFAHKRRMWFLEKNTLNAWYLPIDSYAGAATLFPLGALFKRGGYLVAGATWSLDAGNGPDDYCVFVTSKGEMAIYAGTDPSSSSTWSLVGTYDVGQPVGRKPFLDFGGDLLYLSFNGIFGLSQLAQSTIVDRTNSISQNIDGAVLDATTNFSGNIGWEMQLYKNANFMFVNVPVSQDTLSYQFVMNTITKAWCRFTNMNASCWATIGNDLFFANPSGVFKAWQGGSDNGVAIAGIIQQSYNSFGYGGQKQISMIRPNAFAGGNTNVSYAIDSDYKVFDGSTTITYNPVISSSVWDTARWDTAQWVPDSSVVEAAWLTVPGDLGFKQSIKTVVTTTNGSYSLTSMNIAYKPAGIL